MEGALRIQMLSVQPVLFDARVQREARSLTSAGYDVAIVYVEDVQGLESIEGGDRAWSALRAALPTVRFEEIVLRSRRWRRLPAAVNKAAQAVELFYKMMHHVLASRADVIHCHDLTPAVFALAGRTLRGSRIVYDAHELEVRARQPVKRALQRFFERLLVRHSEARFTVNPEIAKTMSEAYGRGVLVVSNRPTRPAIAGTDDNRLRREHGIRGHERVILYVGWVIPWKRCLEEVVNALARVDENVVLLVMGTGRLDEFRPHLLSHASRVGVAPERVRFIGPYPPGEIATYLSGADLSLVLYPKSESDNNMFNAPNKLFQSLAAGTPVLATDNATLPRYVLHNEIGPVGEVVDPSKPADIAEGMRRALEPARNAVYRANARRLGATINWDEDEARLLEEYRKIADSVLRLRRQDGRSARLRELQR